MREEEIRPKALFDKYLLLAEQDIRSFFSDAHCIEVPCPACGSSRREFQFAKNGFRYHECAECKTLYVNPRPDEEVFSKFYQDSESVRFWATHFYKETEQARQDLLIKPKAKVVGAIIRKYANTTDAAPIVIDIGAGYGGFCVALKNVLKKPYHIVGIEPAHPLQKICREKNLQIIPKFFEDVKREDFDGNEVIAAASFELLEHLYDPKKFIRHCHAILQTNGILIITTLNGQGFDLQLLKEKSKSISPPHHINFFNPQSIAILLEKQGFEIIEVTTPGKLDVDIIAKQLPDISCPFIRDLISACDENARDKLQEIIQDAKMSSHMMIVAKKREHNDPCIR